MYMEVLYASFAGAKTAQNTHVRTIYIVLSRHFLPRLMYMDVLYAGFAGA